LEQKPEALQSWLGQLRQRFGGQPVAVVLARLSQLVGFVNAK
jgi:hypothetical protein